MEFCNAIIRALRIPCLLWILPPVRYPPAAFLFPTAHRRFDSRFDESWKSKTGMKGKKKCAIDCGNDQLQPRYVKPKADSSETTWGEMEFWLVLLLSGGSAPLHVGTFSSMANCEAAARAAVLVTPELRAPIPRNFICVQANDSGTRSPLDQPATHSR